MKKLRLLVLFSILGFPNISVGAPDCTKFSDYNVGHKFGYSTTIGSLQYDTSIKELRITTERVIDGRQRIGALSWGESGLILTPTKRVTAFEINISAGSEETETTLVAYDENNNIVDQDAIVRSKYFKIVYLVSLWPISKVYINGDKYESQISKICVST